MTQMMAPMGRMMEPTKGMMPGGQDPKGGCPTGRSAFPMDATELAEPLSRSARGLEDPRARPLDQRATVRRWRPTRGGATPSCLAPENARLCERSLAGSVSLVLTGDGCIS